MALVGVGCAQAPPVDKVRPYSFETGRTPYSAAICIARNAKSMPGITAEERLQGDAGWEVLVRETSGSAGLAVADIQPRGSGSVVTIRSASVPRGDARSFAQRLMSDCQAEMVGQ
ncbi:MAG: hypothetical protein ACT4P8_18455 [Betaproteobacteria bacterium]